MGCVRSPGRGGRARLHQTLLTILLAATGCSDRTEGGTPDVGRTPDASSPDLSISLPDVDLGDNADLLVLDLAASPDLARTAKVACTNAGLQANSPWPMRGICPSRRAHSPYRGPHAAVKKWAFATTSTVDTSPTVSASGIVYFGSHDGTVYAVDGTTGVQKWSFPIFGEVRSWSPTLGANGSLFVGNAGDPSSFYAVSMANGKPLWQKTVEASRDSAAIAADGAVILGAAAAASLDPATGNTNWSFSPGMNQYLWDAAIGPDGTIYAGASNGGGLYALAGKTGALLWSFPDAGDVVAPPTVGPDGTVYFGSYFGNSFYAVVGATGKQKWKFQTGGAITGGAALGDDGTVYFGSGDGSIYALDGATGTSKWSYATGSTVGDPVLASDGTLYATGLNLYAIDSATGAAKWQMYLGGGLSPAAIGSNGLLYVGSEDNHVYAIGP